MDCCEVLSGYVRLLDNIDTQLLDKAKLLQEGRVSEKDTNVSFNFTEGWFRNSGLYDLKETDYQEKLIDNFIADKCNWNNNKVKSESAKYKRWIERKWKG